MRLPLTSGCEGTCGQALTLLVFVPLPTTLADMELSIPQCFNLCFLICPPLEQKRRSSMPTCEKDCLMTSGCEKSRVTF